MTINTTTVFGGPGIRLAVDLTLPSTLTLPAAGTKAVTGVNTTAALTEMLGLTGRHTIQYLQLDNMDLESAQFQLTVDGTIIWDSTFVVVNSSLRLYGAAGTTNGGVDQPFICDASLSLKVQMSADTSIDLNFLVRPIL